MCSCRDLNESRPLIEQMERCHGGLWGSIGSVWKANDELRDVVLDGICKGIGNANSTYFWEDVWIVNKRLMDLFPYLYSISLQQHKLI